MPSRVVEALVVQILLNLLFVEWMVETLTNFVHGSYRTTRPHIPEDNTV
jgi:hypothetical protein